MTHPWSENLKRLLPEQSLLLPGSAHVAQKIRPVCIAAPGDIYEAVSIVNFAKTHRVPLVPFGNGTAQGIGRPPPKEALFLSTRRLNSVVHYEPDDMVACMQAGITLREVQATLANRGQWLPLDGPGDATLGGMTAADRYGPLALGYGTLRDMVLGITIINGDGVLRKCGGRVVKNVTGYAMDKLYIGSLGTLGLIVDVSFKVRPLPIARREWLINPSNFGDSISLLRAVSAKALPLEMMCLYCVRGAQWRLKIQAAGTPTELDRIGHEIGALSAAVAENECSTAAGELPSPPGFAAEENSTLLRYWCSASKMEQVWTLLSPHVMQARLRPDGGLITLEIEAPAAAEIAQKLTALEVNYRFENASFPIENPFGPPRADWPLMKRIKDALDPQGIMNPGRFVGNL